MQGGVSKERSRLAIFLNLLYKLFEILKIGRRAAACQAFLNSCFGVCEYIDI